jgi:hypothetical protein
LFVKLISNISGSRRLTEEGGCTQDGNHFLMGNSWTLNENLGIAGNFYV